MKNKLSAAFKTFVITLSVAFIATSKENWIYSFFDYIGYENEILKKTALSAVITLLITLVSIISTDLCSKFTSIIKKMDVCLGTKLNGRKKAIKFIPSNFDYESQDLEIEVSIRPMGRLSSILIKKLGITVDVYFNPELLDVDYYNRWDSEDDEIFKIQHRKISIDLLGEINIDGQIFNGREHKLNERFTIKPIRVKNAETSLDYMLGSKKFGLLGGKIAKFLINVNHETLVISCEGDSK